MNYIETSKELFDFIQKSPSMFHSIETIDSYLTKAGFTYLPEGKPWTIEKGGCYFTTRNHSSLIAFKIGNLCDHYHFQLTAAHSDSPTYKVKSIPEIEGPHEYLRLDVEAYGGMIDSTWFDRPLTIAGRVLIRQGNAIESRLLYIDKDILMIPNVAIHFNREVNDGYKYNRQVDLCPLFSGGELKKGAFNQMIADELGVEVKDILGKDLFLVNRQKPVIWGYKDEFVSTPKLDDLQCAFASLKAFLQGNNEHGINVYCCFDNEEVGSNTKQGAMSTFLYDVLKRINNGLSKTEEEFYQAIAKSFLVSCDNAHALHPNHPEKSDVINRNYLNKGIVIKESANQKYTTDAFSRAVFTQICQNANVPVQVFANRSDMVGGSTLGNLSNTQVSLHAVDIGLPQLAMHSSYETAGIKDTTYAIEALTTYFNSDVEIEEAKGIIING
ncbi:M18 family aminopeptidase [Floccifex sp.]|uniref:M18 family aminopeptidase n=1 Tax=Floccifex sp. TaxID=2815810 RepID=UPI003F0DAC80